MKANLGRGDRVRHAGRGRRRRRATPERTLRKYEFAFEGVDVRSSQCGARLERVVSAAWPVGYGRVVDVTPSVRSEGRSVDRSEPSTSGASVSQPDERTPNAGPVKPAHDRSASGGVELA